MKRVSSTLRKQAFLLTLLCATIPAVYAQVPLSKSPIPQASTTPSVPSERKVNTITVLGNKYTDAQAILSFVPFKKGELFNPAKKSKIIKNLYAGLNRFRNIQVYAQNVGEHFINLFIFVEEKKLLKDVIFQGNKQLSEKEIKEKIKFQDIPAIDNEELKRIAFEIKKLYLEKGYHQIDIDTSLEIEGDQAIAVFAIKENQKASIKRVLFKGNKNINDKDLRNIIFTREDWVLSFLDKSGSFHPERLEADKHVLEQHYQNQGYINAKVADVQVDMDPKTSNINLTFEIQEGDLYTINDIKIPAPESQTISEAFLLASVPLCKGNKYSREAIVEAIKRLEMIWGNQGYIFAHIEPSIQPNEDTKTVDLAFYTELGNKVFLNKITIKGNKKTRDRIIRRKLLVEEGDLLTQFKMDTSKDRVESLGYFDQRDGVNWKLIRLDQDHADLDLMLKEIKTGRFNVKLGFGGVGSDLKNPASGLSVGTELADTNLFGSGIHFNLDASWAKEEQSFNLHLAQPWLFDKPISGMADLYHKRPSYDEFQHALPIHEKSTGGALSAGFVTPRNKFMDDTQVLFSLGVDDVQYENKKFNREETLKAKANDVPLPLQTLLPPGSIEAIEYQQILNKEFSPGAFLWLANILDQDHRNHPMHPSRGHKWKVSNKFAFPTFNSTNGFYKLDIDAVWFTPLIGERDLVLKLRGHMGFATPFNNRTIPYGELYNIGGPASVRGYLYGQIGPKFLGDPIGAKKALFVTAELIFPITPDLNMKGVVFYDGGAGWDNPFVNCNNAVFVTDNNFVYRHAVGFGLRMMNPMPIKVDWGFKLDPRKNRFNPRLSESASEVHFGMSYDW